MNNDLKNIEWISVDELLTYPNNAKKHDASGFAVIQPQNCGYNQFLYQPKPNYIKTTSTQYKHFKNL